MSSQSRFCILLVIAALYVWGGGSFYERFDEVIQRVAAWNIYEAGIDLIYAFLIFCLIPPRWIIANSIFFVFHLLSGIKHFLEVTGCNLVRIATEAHIDTTRSVCEAVSGFDYWIMSGTTFGVLYGFWMVRRWYVMEYTAAPDLRNGSYMGFRKLKRFKNLGALRTFFILIFPFSSMSARMHDGLVYSYRRDTFPDGTRARRGVFVARLVEEIEVDSYFWIPLKHGTILHKLDSDRAARREAWTLWSNCVTAICIPHYWMLIRGFWCRKQESA